MRQWSVNRASIGQDNGLSPISAPSHYLNQYWVIINWTLGNTFQWNFNQNTRLFIHENEPENIVCEMAAILSKERWVERYIVVYSMPPYTFTVTRSYLECKPQTFNWILCWIQPEHKMYQREVTWIFKRIYEYLTLFYYLAPITARMLPGLTIPLPGK